MAIKEVNMSGKRYTEEFKIEAIRPVVDRGYSIAEVADRLGTTTHSLYAWKKKYGPDSAEHQVKTESNQEIKRLKKELRRVTEERDKLKKAAVYFASQFERGGVYGIVALSHRTPLPYPLILYTPPLFSFGSYGSPVRLLYSQ